MLVPWYYDRCGDKCGAAFIHSFTVAVTIAPIIHIKVRFAPWAASAAALGCALHLHLFIVYVLTYTVRLSVSWSVHSTWICCISESDCAIGRKAAWPRMGSWMLFHNRGEKSEEWSGRKGEIRTDLKRNTCDNLCICEKAKENKRLQGYWVGSWVSAHMETEYEVYKKGQYILKQIQMKKKGWY